ncbi:hypothetical protein C2845_PM11G13120 [Panicum miliaceum]|uniref:BHLH domain-containing protein n=1 Tax=Panicum miliaceum TaxID=4540 RepID=A0A3L6RU33_PANMI|nr:hypothetical protein C2845_PM11G13120 [Panicum miliaceum]
MGIRLVAPEEGRSRWSASASRAVSRRAWCLVDYSGQVKSSQPSEDRIPHLSYSTPVGGGATEPLAVRGHGGRQAGTHAGQKATHLHGFTGDTPTRGRRGRGAGSRRRGERVSWAAEPLRSSGTAARGTRAHHPNRVPTHAARASRGFSLPHRSPSIPAPLYLLERSESRRPGRGDGFSTETEASTVNVMQGGHSYGAYGYGGYVYDAGAYGSAGGYNSNGGCPSAPAYEDPLVTAGRRAHDIPAPLSGIELQPSEACPKNYVVFDQTCTHSRVTFHPSLARKLGGPPESYGAGGCSPVRQEEDPEEIDALLSLSSSEDAGGDEDDAASTGRTDGSSPDSACSSGAGKKKARVKKMMRALKGVVPGAKRMDTPAALDEAVWYLRSLKLEAAEKLGARGSDS